MKVILVAVCLSLTFGFLCWIKSGSSIVTFDLVHVKGQFIRQLAIRHASDVDVKTSSVHFNRVLQTVLEAYSHKNHVVILERQQVLSGGQDVTDSLLPLIAKAMRGTA